MHKSISEYAKRHLKHTWIFLLSHRKRSIFRLVNVTSTKWNWIQETNSRSGSGIWALTAAVCFPTEPPSPAVWLRGSGSGIWALTAEPPSPVLCSGALCGWGRSTVDMRLQEGAVPVVLRVWFQSLSGRLLDAVCWDAVAVLCSPAAVLCCSVPGVRMGLWGLPWLWLLRGDCSQTQAHRGAGCYQDRWHFNWWQPLPGTFSW